MRVRMTHTLAGPSENLVRGKVYDLPSKRAVELCKGGFAVVEAEFEREDARAKREAEREARAAESPRPEWKLKTSPQDYLEKNPNGPQAELARSVIEAAESETDE